MSAQDDEFEPETSTYSTNPRNGRTDDSRFSTTNPRSRTKEMDESFGNSSEMWTEIVFKIKLTQDEFDRLRQAKARSNRM
mmetsp:Transcript_47385/g.54572  ORF Transcript_47385/g.54572 Transcript_47385/m.54572 type:complete len:80 (+) Transcript_47385:2-241(+)